ncbi:MAG: hypothetical protein KDD55_09120, partial [Bdellovibrionales bacterium]|nr:hypothetical protein [Bdellovibrionales bacterium]
SVLARSNIARYVLEFLTVGFLIIIFGRLLQLVVRDGHRPIGMTFVENLSRRVKPYTLNPLTIMLKTLIVCMIVFELLGKANFSSAWYIYSTLTLILWIFTLILLHSVGKSYWKNTLQHSFLVSLFLASDSAGGCPLGYGNNKKGEA